MPTEGYFYSYMKIKDVGRYYQDFFDDFDEQQFEKLIADNGSGDEYEGEKFILRYDGEAEDCCDLVKKGRAVSAG